MALYVPVCCGCVCVCINDVYVSVCLCGWNCVIVFGTVWRCVSANPFPRLGFSPIVDSESGKCVGQVSGGGEVQNESV